MSDAATGGHALGQGSSYHRKESPTQARADALQQEASKEVWGQPARGSSIPSVKAYRNQLPPPERGIDFDTLVPPTRGSGTPFEARWYENSPGVIRKQGDYVAIPVTALTNKQP
jgi:hypothetical protein